MLMSENKHRCRRLTVDNLSAKYPEGEVQHEATQRSLWDTTSSRGELLYQARLPYYEPEAVIV